MHVSASSRDGRVLAPVRRAVYRSVHHRRSLSGFGSHVLPSFEALKRNCDTTEKSSSEYSHLMLQFLHLMVQ